MLAQFIGSSSASPPGHLSTERLVVVAGRKVIARATVAGL